MPSFWDSTRCLEDDDMFYFRKQAKIILRALTGRSKAFERHPVMGMWRGREEALAIYGGYISSAWRGRGGVDDGYYPWFEEVRLELRGRSRVLTRMPLWFGDEDLHAYHRALLIQHNPEHYREQFAGMDTSPREEEWWPAGK